MTLRARELGDVCDEVTAQLANAPVQRVVQPDASTVLLGFPHAWLRLSADARLGRVHLDEKPAGTGEAAPAFCMRLRKELVGARLLGCRAVEGERAAELRFARGGETRRLWLFLFGRAAQLVLADADGRPLGGIGPARALRDALPSPRSAPEEPSRFGAPPGLSARIAAHYREEAARATAEAARHAAGASLRGEIARLGRLAAALGRDRARAEAAADKCKWGDLLLAHLGEVPRGASSVTLPDDFAAGAPITIPLDPARAPRANAERYYTEHKRLTRGRARIDARLGEVAAARARAEAALVRLADVPDAALPAPRLSVTAKRRGAPARRPPYREFRSATGAAILVGRGADRNDELTFKVARGSDLWLHARDVPGAHVVVPLASGRPVDEQTLLDAATLAAHHSSARGEPQVDIAYTLRKHVRKPPRARPGAVLTAATKTLRVRVEPERLARLLAALVDEEDG
jgi:predicted ribosome quality control (RQC) complex YloA/Tae2 family protein